MAEERKGAVTMGGNPVTLVGPEIKPGQKAPEFKAVGKGLAPVTPRLVQGQDQDHHHRSFARHAGV